MAMNEINRSIKGLLGAVGLLEYCRGFQYCDLVRFLRKGFSICFHFSNLRFIGLHSALSDSVCDFSQNEKWCRLQNSPYFCVFKYARAVKQKVWNEAEKQRARLNSD